MDEKLQRDINDILRYVGFVSGEQQNGAGQPVEPSLASAEEEEDSAPLPEQHGWQPPLLPQEPPIIVHLFNAPPPGAADEDAHQGYDRNAVEGGLDQPAETAWEEERPAPFPTQETAAEAGALPPRLSALHPRQTRMGTRLLVTLACVLFLVGAALATVLLLPLLTASATVTIIPRSRQVSTTTTLAIVTSGTVANLPERQVPGRLLSSLTLSQATSVVTTGTGERPPQAAHGTITFYNAALVVQVVPAGTVLTGIDGALVVTEQDAIIGAGSLSTNGQATVLAQAVQAGPIGNIRAGGIYGPCCRLNVFAQNAAFHGGAQARSFSVVTHADLSGAVASLKTSLMQSVQAAFTAQVHEGETLLAPTCTPTVTADHAVGDEATRLGVTVDETCQAEAYRTQAMHDLMTQITTQAATTQGGAGYRLSGTVEVTVGESSNTAKGQKQERSLTLQVKGTGVWTYQFTDAQLQRLAERIAGKSTREAKAIVLSTPGVQSVTLQLGGDDETTLPRDPGQIKMGQLIGLGL